MIRRFTTISTRAALLVAVAAVVAVAAMLAAPAPRCAAGEVVAVFNFAQRDDDPKYAWLSKGLIVGNKEYRVGYRCPVEAAEEWVPVLNRILDSFVLDSGGAGQAP